MATRYQKNHYINLQAFIECIIAAIIGTDKRISDLDTIMQMSLQEVVPEGEHYSETMGLTNEDLEQIFPQVFQSFVSTRQLGAKYLMTAPNKMIGVEDLFLKYQRVNKRFTLYDAIYIMMNDVGEQSLKFITLFNPWGEGNYI